MKRNKLEISDKIDFTMHTRSIHFQFFFRHLYLKRQCIEKKMVGNNEKKKQIHTVFMKANGRILWSQNKILGCSETINIRLFKF